MSVSVADDVNSQLTELAERSVDVNADAIEYVNLQRRQR